MGWYERDTGDATGVDRRCPLENPIDQTLSADFRHREHHESVPDTAREQGKATLGHLAAKLVVRALRRTRWRGTVTGRGAGAGTERVLDDEHTHETPNE